MYWLIEDNEKIDILSRIQIKEAYVEIIPTCPFTHPTENNISCIYIRSIGNGKGYMIPIDHSETINIQLSQVEKVLESIEKIYVIDKKEFLHYFYHPTIQSLILIYPQFVKHQTSSHTFFYTNNTSNDINTIVPIVKHYESCEKNYSELSPYFTNPINPFYNNKATIVFNIIEKNGIKINPTLFKQYFEKDKQEYVYTQYNLATTTTRPSNSFGGINFSALKKDNGERQCFIPRNDFFIEMDVSAMHPTLLANILDYSFSSDDVHQSFAEMYGVDYAEVKEITFKQMYGGVWKEYEHLPYFSKLKQYTTQLWENFQQNGYIECPISKHVYKKDKLDDMNPQKLLNYLLQNLETSTNVLILWDILKLLRSKNTKVVLYVYDSFLFDVDETEKDTLKQIIDIFNKHNLKVKFKKGTTYNFN
jgi:hypothetical protein